MAICDGCASQKNCIHASHLEFATEDLSPSPTAPASAGELAIGLLADAKIPKDHIEHVFHIDTAGEPPQIAGGQAQLLRDDVFASAWFAQGTLKRPMTARQQMPVTFSGNENGFAG